MTSLETSKIRVGCDFGGVLSKLDKGKEDKGEKEHISTCINMKGAVKRIQKLKEDFNCELFIISYCGFSRAEKTKESLETSGLSSLFNQQYYVKDRKYKKYICKYLGTDFMIDDKEEILNDVKTENTATTTILFGKKPNNKKHIYAKDWNEVVNIIDTYTDTVKKVVDDPSLDISSYCHDV